MLLQVFHNHQINLFSRFHMIYARMENRERQRSKFSWKNLTKAQDSSHRVSEKSDEKSLGLSRH